MVRSGHSVKEIAKLSKKTEQWVQHEWSKRTLKRKTLEDKQGLNGGFLTNCVRNVPKKQSIRVIIHQER